MLILVILIGVYMIVIGNIILFDPKVFNRVIAFFMHGKKIYMAGILRILLGAIFLLAAPDSRLKGVLITLGILVFAGGLLIFVLGEKRIRTMVSWIEKKPPVFARVWGIIAIGMGVLIISSV